MSFDTFEDALAGYRDFLDSEGKPTSVTWLSCSDSRFAGTTLYVFRPSKINNVESARNRFNRALDLGKNIAFCWYGNHDDSSLIALETMGLDPPNDKHDESGSHNYKIMMSPVRVIPINSYLQWHYAKLRSLLAPNGRTSRGWVP